MERWILIIRKPETNRCPSCGNELTELLSVKSGTLMEYVGRGGNVRLDADTYFEPDGKTTDFLCPFCYRSLTQDETTALGIIEGGVKLAKGGYRDTNEGPT